MRQVLSFIFATSFLFPIEGIIVFNDQTIIEGNISSVDLNSVTITPEGLNFPEEILIQSIDSLKINNGMIPIAKGEVLMFYNNGQFTDASITSKNSRKSNDQILYDEVEYVIVPNWSLNLYSGYPIVKAKSFEEFDKSNWIYGLSVGSPYGFFAGDFFMNVIAEFAYYNFQQKNNLDGPSFGGPAYQIGVSPGFFIGNTSFSITACTGLYKSDDYIQDTTSMSQGTIAYKTKSTLTSGFITGASIDIPIGEIILEKYSSVEIFKPLNIFIGQFIDYEIFDGFRVKDIEEELSSFEMRITSRANLIEKAKGSTGWVDLGISFGYEFDYGGHPKLPSWLQWPF
tara:strand:- start:1409 stop:2431 length:1023 start_codon:yes stop_codon:yes gene_type:complete